MSSLRQIATQYHNAANGIAARADASGQLTENQLAGINYYRDCAGKVEALILPEDSIEEESTWNLEGQERPGTVFKGKVTSADKAATPQELLKKAE